MRHFAKLWQHETSPNIRVIRGQKSYPAFVNLLQFGLASDTDALQFQQWRRLLKLSVIPTASCAFATWAIGTTRSMVSRLKIQDGSRGSARQSMFPRAF